MIDRNGNLHMARQVRGAMCYLPRGASAYELTLMRRIDELRLEAHFLGGTLVAPAVAVLTASSSFQQYSY